MPRTSVVATTLAAGMISFTLPSIAAACSKIPVTVQRWSESTVLFIGRATADTIRTGPGDVSYGITGGHFGRAGNRVIYGQSIDVESLSPVDRRLLPAGVKRVVLVPWDYGADCSVTPWTNTARWIQPGTRGIYHAALRHKQHWLNGVPVLDVFSPEYSPYTGVARQRLRVENGEQPLLGVDELYEAVSHLPDPAAMKADPVAATTSFLEWVRANRALAEREPLRQLVRSTVYDARSREISRLPKPFEGTYRFVLSVTGASDREFFLRTTQIPAQSWNLGQPDLASPEGDFTALNPVNGFEIYVTTATRLSELPESCANRQMQSETWIQSGRKSVMGEGGAQLWVGQIGWGTASVAFRKDAFVSELRTGWERELSTRYGEGGPSPKSLIFFGNADGVTRINDEITLADRRTITLRGERVSKQVQTCPNIF